MRAMIEARSVRKYPLRHEILPLRAAELALGSGVQVAQSPSAVAESSAHLADQLERPPLQPQHHRTQRRGPAPQDDVDLV